MNESLAQKFIAIQGFAIRAEGKVITEQDPMRDVKHIEEILAEVLTILEDGERMES